MERGDWTTAVRSQCGFNANAAVFTPDSRTFAVADSAFGLEPDAAIDNWIDLWDVATGKARRLKIETPDGPHEPILIMAFFPIEPNMKK